MSVRNDIRACKSTAAAFIAMAMVWAGLAAQIPTIKAQINATDAEFGLSFVISSLGAMAAMWLAPRVDARFGTHSMMVASALMGLSFLLPGYVSTLFWFTAVMVLTSAASGVADVLMNVRVSEIEADRGRPLMNLNHAIFSFAYAGTAVLTGLAREAGYSPVAVFSAIAVSILLLCTVMRAERRAAPLDQPSPAHARGNLLVWLGGIVVLTAFLTEQAVEGWSALHLERGLGAGAAQGAIGPAILGLTMGFGRLFGQALAQRVADTAMIAWACLISAVGLVLAALAPGIAVAYLGFGLLGLGISVVVPLAMALVGRAVPDDQRVAAMGRASVIGYGAFLVGPGLMGVVSDAFSLPTAFLMVALVLVLVSILIVPIISRQLRLA